MPTIEEQIEHSKTHWSQVSDFELNADKVAEVSNVEVFQSLQSHPKWGTFFQTFGKSGIGELVMGQKFAEGGQVELYDVEIQWNDPLRNQDDLQHRFKWVLKVFKKGTSLRQLQSQWPHGMLQHHVDRMESKRRGDLPKFRPKVPEYVDGWIRELLTMCWQSNPVDRPSFGVILGILLANSKKCRDS